MALLFLALLAFSIPFQQTTEPIFTSIHHTAKSVIFPMIYFSVNVVIFQSIYPATRVVFFFIRFTAQIAFRFIRLAVQVAIILGLMFLFFVLVFPELLKNLIRYHGFSSDHKSWYALVVIGYSYDLLEPLFDWSWQGLIVFVVSSEETLKECVTLVGSLWKKLKGVVRRPMTPLTTSPPAP